MLKELIGRLQDHSDSLRREIRRLQRALAEINGAIALSLDRVERLRSNIERLQAVFGVAGGGRRDEKPREEQRSGFERRSGAERRRARSDVTGLLRWIEGTSLDRRKGRDRRNAGDRRAIVQSNPTVTRMAIKERAGEVISLAEYRRTRKAMPRSRP